MQATEEDIKRMRALIDELKLRQDARCSATGAELGPHEVLASIALGRRDAPLCLAELARAEGQSPGKLRERVVQYMAARPCFGGAWLWAGEQSGHGRLLDPPLGWSGGETSAAGKETAADEATGAVAETEVWNAGDLACGDLVLELRTRLRALKPGQVIKLTATDVGAPEDIPSWCRLTGNRLVKAEKPNYWIQRKDD
jgi:tRNA 2-thiouridine synthesizing protein A